MKNVPVQGKSSNEDVIDDPKLNDVKKEIQRAFVDYVEDNDMDSDYGLVLYFINYKSVVYTSTTQGNTTSQSWNYTRGYADTPGRNALIMADGINKHTITHESLHTLGLQHTFEEDSKHIFKKYATDNIMEYIEKGKKGEHLTYTYKWQWETAIDKGTTRRNLIQESEWETHQAEQQADREARKKQKKEKEQQYQLKNSVMKKYLFILSAMILCSCTTYKKTTKTQQNKTTMELFNIQKYNNNKNEFGKYYVQDDENVKIFQMWDNYDKEYNEFTFIYKQYYCELKAYYPSGRLKYKGKMYEPGNFRIGVWEHYDDEGRLTLAEDYDKKEKVGYKKALEIVRHHYGYRQEDLQIDLINGGEDWFLENIKGDNTGRAASVNTLLVSIWKPR